MKSRAPHFTYRHALPAAYGKQDHAGDSLELLVEETVRIDEEILSHRGQERLPISRAELDEATAKLKIAEAELEEHHRHHERTIKLVEIGAVSREEYEMATTKLKTAEADAEQMRLRHQRAIELARLNPVSRTDFEQAAVKLRTAEVERATAREKLILYGLSSSKVDSLRSPSQRAYS